ncbi:hypothetical protein Ddc_11970 [Ditylenchus destructor]|nr:hypothetical protein Ddc_11970 [Ditylenchus destructor]
MDMECLKTRAAKAGSETQKMGNADGGKWKQNDYYLNRNKDWYGVSENQSVKSNAVHIGAAIVSIPWYWSRLEDKCGATRPSPRVRAYVLEFGQNPELCAPATQVAPLGYGWVMAHFAQLAESYRFMYHLPISERG